MKHPERPSSAKNNRAPALEITNKKLTKTNIFLTLEQRNWTQGNGVKVIRKKQYRISIWWHN